MDVKTSKRIPLGTPKYYRPINKDHIIIWNPWGLKPALHAELKIAILSTNRKKVLARLCYAASVAGAVEVWGVVSACEHAFI